MTHEVRRETILILEDDPGVARLQQRGLERAGYTAVCAGTPEEAIARVRQGGVDLLLVDYRLPGATNGLEFHEQLQSAGYGVPVILVTGFSDDATVIPASPLPADPGGCPVLRSPRTRRRTGRW